MSISRYTKSCCSTRGDLPSLGLGHPEQTVDDGAEGGASPYQARLRSQIPSKRRFIISGAVNTDESVTYIAFWGSGYRQQC
jgi:hypothetical protein